MTMSKKLFSTLQGRASSYWFNAQADAILAQQIIKYLQSKTLPSRPNTRMITLVNRARSHQIPTAYLAACAFALWEINGRMDWEVANVYARLSRFSTHLPSQHYAITPPTPFPILTSWLLPLLGNQQGLSRFLRKHQLTVRVPAQVFRQAIIDIQHLNITHNQHTVAAITITSNDKTNKLHELSRLSSDPTSFLAAAAHTQHTAIFWDQLFMTLLKKVCATSTSLCG
jgi:hypothetical protein